MMKLPPPTKPEMIAEINREIDMRKQVYPKLVMGKKMRQHEADRRIEILEAVRDVLEKLP